MAAEAAFFMLCPRGAAGGRRVGAAHPGAGPWPGAQFAWAQPRQTPPPPRGPWGERRRRASQFGEGRGRAYT